MVRKVWSIVSNTACFRMIFLYEYGFSNNSSNFIFLKLRRGPHFAHRRSAGRFFSTLYVEPRSKYGSQEGFILNISTVQNEIVGVTLLPSLYLIRFSMW